AAAIALFATLVTAYLLSQFVRNSIGVIAPDIAAEMNIPAAEMGILSSAFFFAFAAARRRHRPLRTEALHAGLRRGGDRERADVRVWPHAGRAHHRTRHHGGGHLVLPDRAAHALRPALPARPLRHAGRPAHGAGHSRHA